MTTKHWLGTAAIVLAVGTGSGVAIAQTQPQMNHEGGHGGPATASPREQARPGGGSEAKGGGGVEHAAPEMRQGAKESVKERDAGEAAPSAVREQAESRQPQHESKPAVSQSAEQPAKESAKDAADTRRKQGAADERKGDNRASETNKAETNKAETTKTESSKPAQPGQRQDQQADRHDAGPAGSTQQSKSERNGKEPERAAEKQPGTTPNNQAAQPPRPDNATAQQQSTPNAAGQNQVDRSRSSTTVSVNDQQRTQVIDRLRHDREFDQARTNIDIRINVGERLPDQVRPRRLPPDIVTIVPQYRDYDYTVVHDEIAIVDPRSREIVEIIPQGGVSAERGYSYGGDRTRVVVSDEQRQILRRAATDTVTVGSTASTSSGPTCLSLRRVPDEIARSNPELASYQYLAIGDQVVLVDPSNQRVVQVIDQQQ